MREERQGDGPVRAVVVPGQGLPGDFYRPLAARLGVGVSLLTLPGAHGEPAAPGWDALVDDVLSHVPEGAALIGHSLGGLVALLAAARSPRPLVLLEPAIFPHRAVAAAAARRYAAELAPTDRFESWNGGQWRVARPEAYPPEAIARYLEGRRTTDVAGMSALMAAAPDLYPLPRPPGPLLLVLGARTGWRARLLAALVRRQLRPDRTVVVDAGHWLIHEADDAVATAVVAFLEASVRDSGGLLR